MTEPLLTLLAAEVRALRLEVAAMRADMGALMRVNGTRLTREQVCERIGVHRNSLATMVKDRRFPKPMPEGKWLLATVIEWEHESGKG